MVQAVPLIKWSMKVYTHVSKVAVNNKFGTCLGFIISIQATTSTVCPANFAPAWGSAAGTTDDGFAKRPRVVTQQPPVNTHPPKHQDEKIKSKYHWKNWNFQIPWISCLCFCSFTDNKWCSDMLLCSKKVSNHTPKGYIWTCSPSMFGETKFTNMFLKGSTVGQSMILTGPPLNKSLHHDFLSAACNWSFTQPPFFRDLGTCYIARFSWVLSQAMLPPSQMANAPLEIHPDQRPLPLMRTAQIIAPNEFNQG